MAKNSKLIRLIYYIVGILASIAIILGGYLGIMKFLETRIPCLQVVLDCEHWKDPCEVEEELRGMVEVSHLCKSLKGVMDPNLNVAFQDVNDLSLKIIGEIEDIEPCEADNVALLKSMHTIEMRNNGSDSIENIGIIFEKAKYIEYQKEGEEGRKIRGQNQILIPMGDLSPKGTIEMNAWAACEVSKQPKFKLRLKRGSQDIYVRIPVGKCAALVNKHLGAIWALLLFVCLFCSFAGWMFRTLVHTAQNRHRQTIPIVPIQEQKNEKRETTSGNNTE